MTGGTHQPSLPSQGARIEKALYAGLTLCPFGRSLHRERGLKTLVIVHVKIGSESLPSQGARIEKLVIVTISTQQASLPSQGARIEKTGIAPNAGRGWTSLPSQGAWIEKPLASADASPAGVAPFTGSVD